MKIITGVWLGLAAFAVSAGGATAAQARLNETVADGGAPRASAGEVTWSQSVDASGGAVIEGHVEVPERGFIADITIGANTDASLPASHLVQVSFTPAAAFGEGSIEQVPGLLTKSEPDTRGEALAGATAKVTTNVFLIGLASGEDNVAKNLEMLGSAPWLDLALVYQGGERAILTLEKDAAASQVFDAVMAAWSSAAAR